MQKELHRRCRQLLSQVEDGDEAEQEAVHEAEGKPEGESSEKSKCTSTTTHQQSRSCTWRHDG